MILIECDSTCIDSCIDNKYNCDECKPGYVKIAQKC